MESGDDGERRGRGAAPARTESGDNEEQAWIAARKGSGEDRETKRALTTESGEDGER